MEGRCEVMRKIVGGRLVMMVIGLGIEWFGYGCKGNLLGIERVGMGGVLEGIGVW